ncbi:MAG: hypothetical protein Q9227_007123 [Pyrenula ochraceoflavens]
MGPETIIHDVGAYVHLDGTKIPAIDVIGVGCTGAVIRKGDYVVKIPHISVVYERNGKPMPADTFDPPKNIHYALIECLEREKAIYRRLGEHPGLVRCHNLLSTHPSLEMDFLANGDLNRYLGRNKPERKQKLSWLCEIADTLTHIHEKRVIVSDIHLQNIMLDDNLAAKFIDFSEASLMPPDCDLKCCDEAGSSFMFDVGGFGAMMFEMITGKNCKFEIYQNYGDPENPTNGPKRCDLPSTKEVWLGHIIEKCWTEGAMTAKELAAELDKERKDLETSHQLELDMATSELAVHPSDHLVSHRELQSGGVEGDPKDLTIQPAEDGVSRGSLQEHEPSAAVKEPSAESQRRLVVQAEWRPLDPDIWLYDYEEYPEGACVGPEEQQERESDSSANSNTTKPEDERSSQGSQQGETDIPPENRAAQSEETRPSQQLQKDEFDASTDGHKVELEAENHSRNPLQPISGNATRKRRTKPSIDLSKAKVYNVFPWEDWFVSPLKIFFDKLLSGEK